MLAGGELAATGTLLALGELPAVGEPVGRPDRSMRAAILAASKTCLVSWSTSEAADDDCPFVQASLPELAVFAMLLTKRS